MANRYWVGGSGTWDSTSTTNWSDTSGGSGGFSVPTNSDDVFFDQSSTYTVSMSGVIACASLTVSAGTVTFADGGTPLTSLSARGTVFSLRSGTIWTTSGTILLQTPSSVTLTTNGTTISANVTISGNTYTLGDNLTTSGTFNFNYGTLNLQSYTLTCNNFATGTLSGTFNFGTGKMVCTGSGSACVFSFQTQNFNATGTKTVEITYSGASTVTVRGPLDSSLVGHDVGDALNFYFKAGTYPLNFNTSNYAVSGNVDFTGYSGTATISTASGTYFYGDFKLSSGMSTTNSATLYFQASGTITSNGVACTGKSIGVIGGTLTLADNLSCSISSVQGGTLNLNGKTITCSSSYFINSTGVLTFNGGTVSCQSFTGTSGGTTVAGTGTGKISMTSATAASFTGAGLTYNCNLELAGAGAVTVSGSNTFLGISNAVQPASIKFTAGTTNTFGSFNLSGTAGNLVTIGSTTTSQATISTSSIVVANYLSISYSNATGTSQWYAGANSTNGGNNSGWIFSGFNSGFLEFF